MVSKLFILSVTSMVTVGISSFENAPQFEPVAVIELFTSQGCSSCPSADRLLSQTIADSKKDGKKIFALSFHVDYWNRLGWTDPFSERKYSERQSMYASAMKGSSVYTPQMIVNGSSQFVGSDENELNDAIKKSLNEKSFATFKTLSVTNGEGEALRVQYALEGDIAGSKINFALVSLNETTYIKRGENSGRTLKNENVVRQFISKPTDISGEIEFAFSPVSGKNNIAVVAYIQRNSDLKIIGAAMSVL